MERHRLGDATGARSGPLAKIAVYYTAHLARRGNGLPCDFRTWLRPIPLPFLGHAKFRQCRLSAVRVTLFRARVMLCNLLGCDALAGRLVDDRRNLLVGLTRLAVLLDLVADHAYELGRFEHLFLHAEG